MPIWQKISMPYKLSGKTKFSMASCKNHKEDIYNKLSVLQPMGLPFFPLHSFFGGYFLSFGRVDFVLNAQTCTWPGTTQTRRLVRQGVMHTDVLSENGQPVADLVRNIGGFTAPVTSVIAGAYLKNIEIKLYSPPLLKQKETMSWSVNYWPTT